MSASRKLNPTAIQLSEMCPRPYPQHQAPTDSPIFGTTSVQLSERKGGLLTPKRHQIKHLEFVIAWFGTRGSEVQILSPRPIFFRVKQLRAPLVLISAVCPPFSTLDFLESFRIDRGGE